jgi:peptide/nickel transport system permease protein
MILPWFAVGMLFAALYARMIRASVIETINEDYVRTAWAKGAGWSRVLHSHVLRNALLPVVTMLGMDIGYFLTQAIFVETVFGLPGVGGLLRTSIGNRDLPVIVGIVMFSTTVILVLNLVVDVVYRFIDPRIETPRTASSRRASRAGAGEAPARVGTAVAKTS